MPERAIELERSELEWSEIEWSELDWSERERSELERSVRVLGGYQHGYQSSIGVSVN